MAKRITNTSYKAQDGTSWRMELWDDTALPIGTSFELELAESGFSLSWEGDRDAPSPALLPSSLSFTCYPKGIVQANAITNVVYGDDEYAMVVKLYRTDDLDNEHLEWTGVVLPDSFSEVIEDGYVEMSMRAVDGLAMLKTVDFVDDSLNRYSGDGTAIYWLHQCLKKVPTYNYTFSNLALDMFLDERMIVRPNTAAYATWPDTASVLDNYVLDANCLYSDSISASREKKDYETIRPQRELRFQSTYEVLHSIVSSFGATLTFGKGRWHLFDRERVINLADDAAANYFSWYYDTEWLSTPQTLEDAQDFDGDGKHLLRGATRSGLQAVYAAHKQFTNGGSDLIWRSGVGYDDRELRRALNYVPVPIMTFDNTVNLQALDTRYAPFVGFDGNAYHTQEVENLAVYSNMPDDGVISGISLSNADDGGEFTLHTSGFATFGDEASNLAFGTTGLYRQIVEVSDGTYTFRLRRRMRTAPYDTSGTEQYVGIDLGAGVNWGYTPRYYEEGFWVRDDDARYETAWFELMIGNDPDILEDGTTEQFLEEWFTGSTKHHTPPLLKTAGDPVGGAEELIPDDDRGHFVWRFKETIPMPSVADGATASTEYTTMKVWNPQYLEIAGRTLYAASRTSGGVAQDVKLTVALDQAQFELDTGNYNTGYASATTQGFQGIWETASRLTKKFQLSGLEIFTGDGTIEYDIDTFSTLATAKGSEVLQLPSTALGATFTNSGNRAFNRWRAFHTNDAFDTLEDNLIFSPFNESGQTMNSMGAYAVNRAMQVRGGARAILSGTSISNGAAYGAEMLRPYIPFKTAQFSSGAGVEYFTPMRTTFTGEGRQQFEAISSGGYIYKPISGSDYTTAFDGPSAGGGGGTVGPQTDGGKDKYVISKVNTNTAVTEHIDASGMTGTILITEIQDKIDKVQTTNPITDDDLGGGGATTKFGDLFPIFIKRF